MGLVILDREIDLHEAERQGKPWPRLSLEDVRNISPLFEKDFLSEPSVEQSIGTKTVPGGTATESVRNAMNDVQSRIAKLKTTPGATP